MVLLIIKFSFKFQQMFLLNVNLPSISSGAEHWSITFLSIFSRMLQNESHGGRDVTITVLSLNSSAELSLHSA